MKCLNCNKDITALHTFTRKVYCSRECEEKYIKNNDELFPKGFENVFGKFSN